MSRKSIKVGTRYGNAELISISNGTLTMICDCGNVFEVQMTSAVRNGISRQCGDCHKLSISKATTPSKAPLVEIRPLTDKEESMISDFLSSPC